MHIVQCHRMELKLAIICSRGNFIFIGIGYLVVVSVFEAVSGLKVNMEKIVTCGKNINIEGLGTLATSLGCSQVV